jgi:hypothetical protein
MGRSDCEEQPTIASSIVDKPETQSPLENISTLCSLGQRGSMALSSRYTNELRVHRTGRVSINTVSP